MAGPALGECKKLNQTGSPKAMGFKKLIKFNTHPSLN